MFSHVSVILFTIGLMDTRSLLGHSLVQRGRYASYWNAFLLTLLLLLFIVMLTVQ